jgi:hypothetical protein
VPGAAIAIVCLVLTTAGLAACAPAASPARAAPGAASPTAAPAGEPRYRVPSDVGALVVDEAAFAAFARGVRGELDRELASGALRGEPLNDRLFVLALLDALDDRWPDAVARLDRIAAAEADPLAKAMRGLTIRVWADARTRPGDRSAAFRSALEQAVAALPLDKLRPQLSALRTMAQVFTPEQCRQLVEQAVAPEIKDGTVALEHVHAIAFQRYAVKLLVPVGAIIDAVLAQHGVEPAR